MGGEIEVGRRRSRLDLRRKKKGKVKCGVVDDHTCAHKVELPKKSPHPWRTRPQCATGISNIRGAHAIVHHGCVWPFHSREGHALRRSAPPPCAPRLTLTTVVNLT